MANVVDYMALDVKYALLKCYVYYALIDSIWCYPYSTLCGKSNENA